MQGVLTATSAHLISRRPSYRQRQRHQRSQRRHLRASKQGCRRAGSRHLAHRTGACLHQQRLRGLHHLRHSGRAAKVMRKRVRQSVQSAQSEHPTRRPRPVCSLIRRLQRASRECAQPLQHGTRVATAARPPARQPASVAPPKECSRAPFAVSFSPPSPRSPTPLARKRPRAVTQSQQRLVQASESRPSTP